MAALAMVMQQATPEADAVAKPELEKLDAQEVDDAARFLAASENYPPMTPEEEKMLVRKFDRWMIPYLLFLGTLSAVDKVQISTASLYGWQTDLQMHGQQYSWVGSILSLGQVVGMFPSSYLVHRLPTAKYLAVNSILWSILTLLYAACKSWKGVMALRFFMGMAEAVTTPAVALIIVSFYKKSEQPPRNGIIMSAFSSVINGFLSWLVGKIPETASLARWQYLFLLTGGINVIYSCFMLIYLPDSPMNAHFLSPKEKYHAVQRLAENRTGMQHKVWKWSQFREAIVDIRLWLLCLFNISINIPNGGLITFAGIIVKNLGFNAQHSALLTMPNGLMSTFSGFTFSLIAAKWHNRRCLVAAIAVTLPLIGTSLVYGLPRTNIPGQMVGLYLMYCYWGPYVVTVSLYQANIAGQTKKTTVYSILFLGYAAGNLIGPQTFQANQAPAYTGGTVAMLVCYCTCIGITMIYWFTCVLSNRNRDKTHGKPRTLAAGVGDQELIQGYQDLTDKQQKDFRYTT